MKIVMIIANDVMFMNLYLDKLENVCDLYDLFCGTSPITYT